jgi:spermidine synthase
VLVVACGAAVTAGAASIDPRVEHLTIAEIEPLVPTVVASTSPSRTSTSVDNPKVTVAIDDGRHFLAHHESEVRRDHVRPVRPVGEGRGQPLHQGVLGAGEGTPQPRRRRHRAGSALRQHHGVAKSEIATFFEAFPNGIVWGNTVRGEGYDIVLSGQVEPARIDVDALERLLASPEFAPVAQLAAPDRLRLRDGAAVSLRGRGQDLRRGCRAPRSTATSNLRLQFLAGFGVDRDQRMEIYRGIVGYRRFPDDMFVGRPKHSPPSARP